MADQGEGGTNSPLDALTIVVAVWYGVLVLAVWVVKATAADGADLPMAVVVTFASLALAPIALLAARRSGGAAGSRTLERKIDRLIGAIEQASREQGLSEGAKRVLHRREERELLRRAIEQDIQAEDWDAGMVLVKELAERFGYRSDAEEFRARIERARAQTLDRKVMESLTVFDEHLTSRRWPEAYAEAARIQRLYPDSHRVGDLKARVDEAHQGYRGDLERRFLIAAQREEVDQAMALLRELDQYLSPTEAERFQEVARGVIGKSRENLGVRFKLMVQDHQWSEAIGVGQQIIAEFPNTRMAQEVRELLPVLRERSATGAKADVPRPTAAG